MTTDVADTSAIDGTAVSDEAAAGIIIAKIGGAWMRVDHIEDLEAGTQMLDSDDLGPEGEPTKDALATAYSEITGTSLKKWKTRKLVAESILHQANSLPLFVPAAEVVPDEEQPIEMDGGAKQSAKSAKRKYKVTDGNVRLVPDSEAPDRAKKVAELPLQARTIATVLLQMAAAQNATEFKRSEVVAALEGAKESGLLVTKQPVKRVLDYYLAKLVAADVIRTS